jgi:phenylacetate-CoA ligase
MLTTAPSVLSLKLTASLSNHWKALRNQWCEPAELAAIQNRKLRKLVQTAYENVAYYRTIFDAIGLSPASIQTVADLSKIPITTKSDLQGRSTDEILHSGIPADLLTSEHSSGSMGRPFRVYYDLTYHSIRNMLFLRGLFAAGYRIGQKVQLVTDAGKKDKPWLRWHYSSILDPPERLLAELNRERPNLLYGCKTPLVSLAEHIRDKGAEAHRPKRIVCTAELLDPESRSLLEKVFSAPVFDFYGSTEMGLVGWECSAKEGHHLSADSVIVEFLPVLGSSGLSRMIMTNLDLEAMPLIRYDSGDLGLPGPADCCRCGRRLPRMLRVEGRQNDCLKMRDGRRISPYRLTCAMEKIPGIQKYQIIQTDWEEFTVRIRPNGKSRFTTGALVQETMRSVLGGEINVTLDFTMPLEHQAGSKFHVVESKLPLGDWHPVAMVRENLES